MPNQCSPKRTPRYRLHRASGQAIVTIDSRDVYLGKFGTTASREAYRVKIAEWRRALRRAKQVRSSKKRRTAHPPSETVELSVVELMAAYLKYAAVYYRKDGKPTNELAMIKAALKVVREQFGRVPISSFGPRALKACRETMIDMDWSRMHINKQVGRIKRMFKWGVEEEVVSGSLVESLQCVAGLKRGRSRAREGKKIRPVSDRDFRATLEHLSPVVADMLQLQRLTGARPGEICDLRPCDLNRKSDPWEYIPESHKTEHYDRPRVIFVGPKAQQILLPYLLRPSESYCFSPREAEDKRRDAQHEARVTPLGCGNRPGTNRKARPKRRPREKYDRNSFGRAVRRAAEKAGVAVWSPHRARHTFATEVRKTFGLEAAQVCLGHSRADVTQVYAARDYALAARVAREVG